MGKAIIMYRQPLPPINTIVIWNNYIGLLEAYTKSLINCIYVLQVCSSEALTSSKWAWFNQSITFCCSIAKMKYGECNFCPLSHEIL